MSRIDSILQAARERGEFEDGDEDSLTSSSYPCRVGASCPKCDKPLLYMIVPTYDLVFGHNSGFPLTLVWAPEGWTVKSGLLHVFRRFPLADPEMIVLECGKCCVSTNVQLARDGGLLPIDTTRIAQVKIPSSYLKHRTLDD